MIQNSVFKNIKPFEAILFLFIFVSFLLTVGIFVDNKSNEKLLDFIHNLQKKQLEQIAENINSYTNNVYAFFDNLIISETGGDTKYPVIVYDAGGVIYDNIGKNNYPKPEISSKKGLVLRFSKDISSGIVYYYLRKNGRIYSSYVSIQSLISDSSPAYADVVIYDEGTILYSENYKEFFGKFSRLNEDKYHFLEEGGQKFLFSSTEFRGVNIGIYGAMKSYFSGLSSQNNAFSIPAMAYGIILLLLLFLLKIFISRFAFEKEKYEKLFQLEHEKFKKIVEAIGEGVALIDNDYNILFVNDYVKNRVKGDKKGKCYSVLAGRNSPCEQCGMIDVALNGELKNIRFENFFSCAGGYFDIIWTPLLDERGEVVAVVELIRDVTDAVKMQNALLKSEHYLKEIIENAPEPIVSFDENFNIKTFSNEALKVLKIEPDKITKITDIVNDSTFYDKLVTDKFVDNMDLTIDSYENKSLQVKTSVSKIEKESGYEYIAIFKDVTKIRQLEVKLIQSEKLSALGLLAGGVAHEINNPLVGILNFAQLLAKRFESGTYEKKLIDTITEAGEQTKEIVQNLLIFARQKSEQKDYFDINDSAEFALKILGSRIKYKNITAVNKINSSMRVFGNKGKIHQVFLNLLVNSIDAVDTGGYIEISSEEDEKGGFIKIYDNGKGISSKVMAKIFDPFFTTKKVGQGTGLGLFLSQAILHEHGWEFELDSVENKYTAVKIYPGINYAD
ncbi:MAG: hypothetical protein FXF49_06100 [Flexistipes sinusarabici]|uniref:histidine kinase n=1 Tax=Flexistipes sinusarabici TaxID=2352 RepID=A0A5D0MRF9_FLESI|nr:ATP-binding protein [Flexistipes sinusarabici]TYB33479.1 MAG: hypothetical protein FXF49_06100 [Flexistipes sinusarabici]